MQGAVLIGVAALRSHTACRFLRRSHLVELVGMLVGAPLLLGTLGTGVCISMECMILLLLSIWGVGTLGGVYVGPQIGMNPELLWGLPKLEY